MSTHDARELRGRSPNDRSETGCRRGDKTHELRPHLLEGGQGRQSLDAGHVELALAEATADDLQLLVLVRETDRDLGCSNRIFAVGECGRPFEQVRDALKAR